MKIIVAPDSFKGSLRSVRVAEIIRDGLLSVLPEAEVVCLPMADGGEGTVAAVVAATGGSVRKVRVSGPLGEEVEAEFGVFGNTRGAVIEVASACGMELMPRGKLNPMDATTYGVGELLGAVLEAGFNDVTIGVGGSATVDGGVGLAQALGYKLLDAAGREVPRGGKALGKIKNIDRSAADPRLKSAKIRVAADVTNPLLGVNGAATVYGPQKGASPAMVRELEAGLANLARVWQEAGRLENVEQPGDGAAGGLGAGLRAFCNAELVSGAKLIAELTGLGAHLKGAACLITGEGCADVQTFSGKLCAVAAEAARSANVPVVLLAGALKGEQAELHKYFDLALSIATGPESLADAMAATAANLHFMGRNVARMLKNFR